MRPTLFLFALLIGGCAHVPSAAPKQSAISQHAAPQQHLAPTPDYSYRDNVPLSQEERREIETLVHQLTDEPIMSISADSDGYCDVRTGVVRGPLDGGGSFFKFAKRNGRWEQIEKDVHRGWVS